MANNLLPLGPARGVMDACYHQTCDSLRFNDTVSSFASTDMLVKTTQAMIDTIVDATGAVCPKSKRSILPLDEVPEADYVMKPRSHEFDLPEINNHLTGEADFDLEGRSALGAEVELTTTSMSTTTSTTSTTTTATTTSTTTSTTTTTIKKSKMPSSPVPRAILPKAKLPQDAAFNPSDEIPGVARPLHFGVNNIRLPQAAWRLPRPPRPKTFFYGSPSLMSYGSVISYYGAPSWQRLYGYGSGTSNAYVNPMSAYSAGPTSPSVYGAFWPTRPRPQHLILG